MSEWLKTEGAVVSYKRICFRPFIDDMEDIVDMPKENLFLFSKSIELLSEIQ